MLVTRLGIGGWMCWGQGRGSREMRDGDSG